MLAVVADETSPDPFALGTVYPFSNWTVSSEDIESDLIEVTLGEGSDASQALLWVRLDGYCTRTGSSTNTIEGYCHFTYTVYDPTAGESLGSFVAEGPVTNPNMSFVTCSSLAVTGGTSLFQATTGLVMFCPAVLDTDLSPPLVESLPEGSDLFEDVDGYLHMIELSLDEEFVVLAST